MTPAEFAGRLRALGAVDAGTGDFGIGDNVNGHLPDGSGIILSGANGWLECGPGGQLSSCAMPLMLIRYEPVAVNAARWPDGRGCDFNDPAQITESVSPFILLGAAEQMISGEPVPDGWTATGMSTGVHIQHTGQMPTRKRAVLAVSPQGVLIAGGPVFTDPGEQHATGMLTRAGWTVYTTVPLRSVADLKGDGR